MTSAFDGDAERAQRVYPPGHMSPSKFTNENGDVCTSFYASFITDMKRIKGDNLHVTVRGKWLHN